MRAMISRERSTGIQDIEAVLPGWMVHNFDTEIGRERLSDEAIDRPIQPSVVTAGAGNE